MSAFLCRTFLCCAVLSAPWASVRAAQAQHGGLTVVYQDARDRSQLGAVYRAWDAALRDLRALGLAPAGPVSIEAARDAADFAARTGEPATIAASTRGTVIRTQRLSALAARGLLPLTLRHEAFHAAQPPGLDRWLAEGLARVFSGEATNDPRTPTGLESVSNARLDLELQGRDPRRLSAAYREATRRAGLRVRNQGWKEALN